MEGQIFSFGCGIFCPFAVVGAATPAAAFFYLIFLVKEIPVPGIETRVLVPRFPVEMPAALPPTLALMPLLLRFSLTGPTFLLFLNLIAMVFLLFCLVVLLHGVHVSGCEYAGRQRHDGNTDK